MKEIHQSLKRRRVDHLVGIISDTHGIVRQEALDALRGSDLIIHAGDIGKPEIINELRAIAPVVAVRGNVDTEAWANHFHKTEAVDFDGTSIYIIHNIAQLDIDQKTTGINVIVYGHSHTPTIDWNNSILYFNPGSAGPKRFKLPVSVGLLRISATSITPEIITLNEL